MIQILNILNFSPNATTSLNLFTADASAVSNILGLVYDMSDCLQNCSNNGVCKFSDNKFGCSCFDNYLGKSCDTSLNPCTQNKCLNNGTCVYAKNETDGFKCECDTSIFYGEVCEYELDLCLNYTCLNKGICETDSKSYLPYCKCLKYFSGPKCEKVDGELTKIKSFISTASIIALAFLSLFYLIFIVHDLFKYVFCKSIGNGPSKKKISKKISKKKVEENFQYKN